MTDKDPIASKRALMVKIQTEGAEAAYEALVGVCRDTKAPAPARATAGAALFRAGGFMDTKQNASDKKPEEMTAAELASRISELYERRKRRDAGLPLEDDDDQDDDKSDAVFG